MKFKSLGYCFVQGLKNIGRNRIFSLASVVTMSLCIFILGKVFPEKKDNQKCIIYGGSDVRVSLRQSLF